jgi:plastocyanin
VRAGLGVGVALAAGLSVLAAAPLPVVAQTPEPVVLVGNYECLDLGTARAQIEEKGLVLATVTPQSPPADDSWLVQDQVPYAGEAVPTGTPVDLVVSGPFEPCPGPLHQPPETGSGPTPELGGWWPEPRVLRRALQDIGYEFAYAAFLGVGDQPTAVWYATRIGSEASTGVPPLLAPVWIHDIPERGLWVEVRVPPSAVSMSASDESSARMAVLMEVADRLPVSRASIHEVLVFIGSQRIGCLSIDDAGGRVVVEATRSDYRVSFRSLPGPGPVETCFAAARAAPTATPGQTGDLEVVATEFAFEPAEMTVRAAVITEVTLVNEGIVEHDLTVDELDLQIQIRAPIAGKASGTIVSPRIGTYQVYCSILGHRQNGMIATLVVEP